MALKRRIKKLTKSEIRKVGGRHYLMCGECGNEEVEVPSDIGRVTCATCVQKMVAPPVGYKKTEKSDKPRGWHFKQYFEHNGVVYSKGVEVTDQTQIKVFKKAHMNEPTPVKKNVVKKKVVKKVTKTKVTRGRKNARSSK
jgi:ribosomal protein S27E